MKINKKLKKKSKILVRARLIAEEVELNRKEYSALSIEDLKLRTDYLIEGLQKGKFTLDDILVDAFSIAREIIYREYGMLAYTVQMMGAYIVHCGDFAEMYTGEGKTLTILLVAFLNALAKKGVHIVTVNEYLVERDAMFAQKAFEKLGITVGYNTSELNKNVKKEMFSRDITYTTNSELGFDYLRDNMVRSMDEKVIRDLFFVIIDEADSVLIDEARTPLIISGMPKEDYSLYLDVDNVVSSLTNDDYFIDAESNTISLTDSGTTKVENFFNLKNLYSVESSEIVHKVTNALIAHYVFANGREYIVKEDKIYLVDQFTGRVLEGRSYNAGLQQAIQAKERVKIEPENVVMATITYQSFFRLYKRLSGVSGTAMTEAEEFLKIYNMVVVKVPTNRPIVRVDKADYIFGSKTVKWNHVVEEIINRHKKGQPILVGTSSVSDSEILHQKLKELKIPHQVLNARDNSKEAEIVKLAGQVGAITISTNMAGRGTDIKVTDEVRALGGLYVIGTERHESRRVDNQLRGRTGRQGDPGESRFFTSLEDSLFKRFATDRFAKASEKLQEDFFDSKFFSRMLDRTQKKVEGLNFDIRKNLMDYDHVLSLQRELVYKQRDQILLQENNKKIIFNMAKEYADNLTYNLRNKDNSAIIDSEKFVDLINNEFIKFEYFKASEFDNMVIDGAREFLLHLFDIIINTKFKILSNLDATNVIGEILLTNVDQKWTTHIDKMTKLREGVSLRSLEQRSPLNIYIEDGNNLFEKMKSDIVRDVINGICKLSLPNESVEMLDALDESGIKKFEKKKVLNYLEDDPNTNSKNAMDQEINYDNLKEKEDFVNYDANNFAYESIENDLSPNIIKQENKQNYNEYVFDDNDKVVINNDVEKSKDEEVLLFDSYPEEQITLDDLKNDQSLSEKNTKLLIPKVLDNKKEDELLEENNSDNIIDDNQQYLDENFVEENPINDNDEQIDELNNNSEIDNDINDDSIENINEIVENINNPNQLDNENINLTNEVEPENEFADIQPDFVPNVYVDEYIENINNNAEEDIQDVNETVINDNQDNISNLVSVKPTGPKLSVLKPKMKKYDPSDQVVNSNNTNNPNYLFNPYFKDDHVDNVLSRDLEQPIIENNELFNIDLWGDDLERTKKIFDDNFSAKPLKKPLSIDSIDEVIIDENDDSKIVFDQDQAPMDLKENNENKIDSTPISLSKILINDYELPKDIDINQVEKSEKPILKINDEILEGLKREIKIKPRNNDKNIETEIFKESSKNYFLNKKIEDKNKKTFDQQLIEMIIEKSKSN